MKSKYQSGKSVGKNQTVPINVDDPRLSPDKIGQTKARTGAEIDIVGLDGKSLIMGGTVASTSSAGKTKEPAIEKPNFTPPIGNEPPKYYPGGSGAFVIVPTDPTDVAVVWSGEDLVISFNWDYNNEYNATVSQFIVELTSGGVTKRTPANTFVPNKTQTAQTITVTKSTITSMFNVFRTNISAVCVLTGDPLNNISNSICAPTVPAYVLSLSVPTITVTAINNGYSVAFTTPTQSVYDAIEIVEYESDATTEPTGVDYIRTYFNTINPAVVTVSNFNYRWVKARFSSDGGTYTAYSTAVRVKPTSPVSVDLTPPDEVSQLSGVWSGDNIIVSYKLPLAVDTRAARVQIELTSPNSLVGYFYRFPDGSGRDQTATITKKDLFDQFGEHYSSFTGILRSIDTSDNRTSGVSFNVAQRANPLDGVIPTFTTIALSNAYSVNFTLPTGASYGEVYAKHTAWSADPTDDTYLVYSGLSPAVIVDTDYTPVYIKLHYYDDFGNTSSYSNQSNNSVTPANPGQITSFENPISFGPDAVIYAGDSATSGTRTLFKTGGIFAYDATNTSPSTQIVSNASAGSPTFITNQASIGGWTVSSTKIEKLASGKYTGMESGSTYSFYAGSTTSGGDANAKFIVTPTGEVTAREITIIGNGNASTNLISAGGLFTVKNDGTVSATSANISGSLNVTGSSTFTGNVKLDTGGSLYSGSLSGGSLSGLGFILNKDGVLFQNSSGTSITQITSSDGKLITKSANIGGWAVDSSSISRTGTANISLNSTSGNISVSAQNISGYTSGINGPYISSGSALTDNIENNVAVGTENVFWAGTGGATSTSNAFRVTLGGNLYASAAKITGTIASKGALGTITLDGNKDWITLSGSADTSYILTRNSNIYITAPSTNGTLPWSSSTGNPGTTGKITAAPTSEPYFAAGKNFNDPWGNISSGIGIYTGSWDYFNNGGTSDPFVTVSKSGTIQLSASPDIGLIVEKGGATGDAFTVPTIMMYTSKAGTAPYKPSTAYGSWATFQKGHINLSASTSAFISIFGDSTNGGTSAWPAWTNAGGDYTYANVSNSIYIRSGNTTNATSDKSAYGGASQIIINGSKISITGIPRASAFDMGDYRTQNNASGYYRNVSPLGYPPRQRMVIEDPVSGEAQLGLGIYYLDYSGGKSNVSTPVTEMGVQGDIALVF
jgi:hypothetical protein